MVHRDRGRTGRYRGSADREERTHLPRAWFELTARADRLDRLSDGRIGIVDYKTGAPPGVEEVLTLAPQLPLEALIVQKGGFAEIGPAGVARLEYYHISGRKDGGDICPRGERTKPAGGRPAVTLAETIENTEKRLTELLTYYQRSDAQFMSRKIPRAGGDYSGDYDHLARVAEWSLADEAEDA
jgi:ATP-dependent helicase/nuclease subunit B